MIKKVFTLYFLIILIPIGMFSQVAVPFKARYETTLNGDMAIVSNNILNRINKKYAPNNPYNDQSHEATANDDFDMEYIDIDQDKITFSSSSAALFVSNPQSKKVRYAGLYWSATYKYESGYKKGEDKFVSYDEDRKPIDEILIKFPGIENYVPIKGEIIFDGLKNKNFKETAPYAVYADITTYVTQLENPFDFYTVANIRATQGTLLGGAAAGWTMVIIYEDPNLSEKKIVVNDGFAGVNDTSIDVGFKNLNLNNKGDVKAKIAISTLEGDFNVDGDLVYFSSSSNPTLYNVKSFARKTSNFFNSTITVEGENNKYRIPNSLNTLGYDSFYETLFNPNNTYVSDNVSNAKIRLKSSKDIFYVFFTAINLEVRKHNTLFDSEKVMTEIVFQEDTFKLVPREESGKVINNSTKKTDEWMVTIDKKPKEVKKEEPEEVLFEEKKSSREVAFIKEAERRLMAENTSKSDPILKMEKEVMVLEKQGQVTLEDVNKRETKLELPGVNRGYYIVANVFADKRNAANFMLDLRNQGLKPNYFINPKNNFLYVYLHFSEDKERTEQMEESNMNGLYESEIWILEINMDKKS